jgi:mono/diheme cytochrome c family protein
MARVGQPWLAAALAALLAPATATLAEGTAPDAPPAGDAMVGRALFIGARAFRTGASPCGACHAIGGESAPFAASMGPELSQSFEGLDAVSIDGMLEDPPFPTMAPLYAGRPLTPDERADLTAFLLQASGKPAPGGARVALWAALLAAVALGAIGLAARRRPGPARADLIARAGTTPRRPRPARVHGGAR